MKTVSVRLHDFKGLFARLACLVVLAAVFTAAPAQTAWAQTAPPLLTAGSYAVIAQTVTNVPAKFSSVNGDLGVSPGAIAPTGFPNGLVGGTTNIGNAASLLAKSNARTAYDILEDPIATVCTVNYTGNFDLVGLTLVPGVYCSSSSFSLSGTLTLDGGVDPGAVWIFKTAASTLTTGSNSSVVMKNSGQACNVFWKIGSSATLGTGTQFIGTILANASISLNTGANVVGRALAGMQASGAGAVTMDDNDVTPSACGVAVAPTVSKAFNPATINAGGNSVLTITVGNSNDSAAVVSGLFTDTLPSGVTFVGINTATTTCGGAVTNTAGTLTLTSGSIPIGGCTVTAVVQSSTVGSHTNTTGTLTTDKGNAGPASAVLEVKPAGTITPRPGLSLGKTAFPTTYTAPGTLITYTYVLTNTGNTTLTGPFTVVDDKLGTFACGSASTILGPGQFVTCTNTYTTVNADIGNYAASLPHGANINTGPWLGFVNSTQATKITGAGPDVPNGTYPCWCIQDHVPTDLHNQPAVLYSTIGSTLPNDVFGLAWGKVNYTLNHKIRGPYGTGSAANLKFLKDVQTAIWVLTGETNPEWGVSATAKKMIDAANAQPSFVPVADDLFAVIIYSDGMGKYDWRDGKIQESICEIMPKLKSIANKATGSGGGVRSNQVQVVVRQVR